MVQTYASAKQFLGIAKEVTQGTPVAMTATIPIEKFEPEDKPVWLHDKALRGSMVDAYGMQQGVIKTDFSMSGPVFGDTLGWLLGNILGDVAPTGTTTTPTGTLSAGSAAGATSVSASVSIPASTQIQIDTGNLAEVVTTSGAPTGTGPYTIPVPALRYAHASGVAITAVTTPFTHGFAVLNSGQGQPTSHTLTHFQGPTATVGARQFPGACLSELTLKWNAETELFMFDAKGECWPSVVPGATPTSAPSTVTPIASWRGLLGIGGPASGGTLVKTVTDGEITIKRALEPVFTTQNVQTPYVIQRGPVDVSGKLSFIAADETPYTTMLNNTQPQLQLIVGNGQTGANLVQVQVDCQNAAYETAKPEFGKAAVGYQATLIGVANTANAGPSGGYSPGKVTVTNSIAPGTYI